MESTILSSRENSNNSLISIVNPVLSKITIRKLIILPEPSKARPTTRRPRHRLVITLNQFWYRLPMDLQLSKYLISKEGQIRNVNGKILNFKPKQNGYVRVQLFNDNGDRGYYYMHRLVTLTFLPNPEKKPITDHINGIRNDNRVENLRWVNLEESVANQVRPINYGGSKRVKRMTVDWKLIDIFPSAKKAAEKVGSSVNTIQKACRSGSKTQGYRWAYHVDMIPGEEWRFLTINGVMIGASSEGRIHRSNGGVTYGSKTGAGYRSVNVNKKDYLVHRLVCMTFHSNPDSIPTVNHKDENKENNRAGNLEWATHKKQMEHSRARKVRQLTMTGEVIAEFVSLMEASRQIGIQPGGISMACRGIQKSAGGFRWEYINNY